MLGRVLNMAALNYLSCFTVVLKGIHDYSIHFRLRIFPIFWSQTWKYNIQTNERLPQVYEKLLTTQFYVFDLSFIFFILMSRAISVIKRSSMCMCAGACTCDCTHQIKKTAKYIVTPIFSWDIANFIILQSDWLRAFWLKIQKPEFSVTSNLQSHIADNVNFQST